jgi:hypothetical protein
MHGRRALSDARDTGRRDVYETLKVEVAQLHDIDGVATPPR